MLARSLTVWSIPTALMIVFAEGAVTHAATVTLNDPSFENSNATNPNEPDNTNFRNWGPEANNLATFDAGAGAGNNEGVWLIRGFGNTRENGQLRRDEAVGGRPGMTGLQYFSYGQGQSSVAERAAFQYVSAPVGQGYTGDFELLVDVFRDDTFGDNQFDFRVVGFDDPSEVTVDVGGRPGTPGEIGVRQVAGATGDFEQVALGLTTTSPLGEFTEKSLSGTLTGEYDYVGVFLVGGSIGGGTIDRIGFDNVRLDVELTGSAVIPEPATLAVWMIALGSLGLARSRTCR